MEKTVARPRRTEVLLLGGLGLLQAPRRLARMAYTITQLVLCNCVSHSAKAWDRRWRHNTPSCSCTTSSDSYWCAASTLRSCPPRACPSNTGPTRTGWYWSSSICQRRINCLGGEKIANCFPPPPPQELHRVARPEPVILTDHRAADESLRIGGDREDGRQTTPYRGHRLASDVRKIRIAGAVDDAAVFGVVHLPARRPAFVSQEHGYQNPHPQSRFFSFRFSALNRLSRRAWPKRSQMSSRYLTLTPCLPNLAVNVVADHVGNLAVPLAQVGPVPVQQFLALLHDDDTLDGRLLADLPQQPAQAQTAEDDGALGRLDAAALGEHFGRRHRHPHRPPLGPLVPGRRSGKLAAGAGIDRQVQEHGDRYVAVPQDARLVHAENAKGPASPEESGCGRRIRRQD